MPLHDPKSLRDWLRLAGPVSSHSIHGAGARVAFADLLSGSILSARPDRLAGRSVLVATRDQLVTALALVELDGAVRRMVLCPPDLSPEHLPSIIAAAAVDVVVSDRSRVDLRVPSGMDLVRCGLPITPVRAEPQTAYHTQWVLLTSGTTGVPKLVVHTLASLTDAFRTAGAAARGVVWSTFYDIRRYGGLQILLRAICGGATLVLSDPDEPTAQFLVRAGDCGVTHISGTPSHWRRALMSRAASRISPGYVRLSGEIADQAVLDRLRACYRAAGIGHAFASTEAGVAFEVTDGLSGFPAGLLDGSQNGVEIRVVDGSLRLRSARAALCYLGADSGSLADAEGFVDTGDTVERRGDRYHFIGRKGGIINVGGRKVHPEEVEAVINRYPGVQASIVKARRSPITGAIVVAEIVAAGFGNDAEAAFAESERLKEGVLDWCRGALAPYKVPAVIRIVSSLDITASGKLVRRDA